MEDEENRVTVSQCESLSRCRSFRFNHNQNEVRLGFAEGSVFSFLVQQLF